MKPCQLDWQKLVLWEKNRIDFFLRAQAFASPTDMASSSVRENIILIILRENIILIIRIIVSLEGKYLSLL